MKSSKKSKMAPSSPGKPLSRPLVILLSAAAIAAVAYWTWEANPDIPLAITQYIDNGEIKTLEVRYTPEQMMELHGKELLNEGERSLQKAELKFFPHALFSVKFSTPETRTREGVLLWSLVDGEMVIDSENWEKSHGFEDAINANASRNDFKILNALEKAKGKMSIEQLQKELHVDEDVLLLWLEHAKEKYLVVQKGNDVQLHFENPRLHLSPRTKLNQSMVAKPYNYAQKVSWRYSPSQVEKIARAAFGQDFAIRSQEIVFLPVYSLDILNPDGSIRTIDFNAVTGAPIKPHYFK